VKFSTSVAIIEPVGGHGGMDYYDFGLSRGLAACGCDVTLYTCDETNFPPDTPFSYKVSFKGIYGKNPKIFRAFRYFKGLWISLIDAKKKGHPLVHLHMFHAGILERLTVALVKLLGFKLVITVHDVESFSGSSSHYLAQRVFGDADHLIAHNSVSRYELTHDLKIPLKKVSIINHGNYIDFSHDLIPRNAARNKLDIPLGSEVLLFFGQIKKVKGLDLLLHAFARFRETHQNALLLIAGKVWKDHFSSYQELIDEYEINDSVKADIRYIPDKEASLYYAASDVVVLPYRKIYQSGILLMAMSYKRTVVASDLPGMTEVITSSETGYLFKSGDTSSLADVLREVFLSDKKREQVALNGYNLMKYKYNWLEIGKTTSEAYKFVLSDK